MGGGLVDEIPDALLAVSPSGVVLFWSQGAQTLFGYSPDEALGHTLAELVVPPEHHADDAAQLDAAYRRGLAVFETVRRRKDGSLVSVDVTARAVRGPGGEVTHLAISKKDVTQLKVQREAGVLESRFRGLLDAVPDAMVLVNADGRIVLVNPEAERLFGWPRRALIGQFIEVLVPERFRGGHPGHRGRYMAAPRTRTMAEGRDLSALRRDGTEFPAEISLSQVQVPEGTFTSAAIRDVSRRRKTEARFKALLEAAPDAIVIVDPQGTIAIVNAQAERLFGYAREELVGQPIEVLVPPSHRGGHADHRAKYTQAPRARGMGAGLPLEAVRKDGTRFPVEISLSPLETEEGTLISSAIRDVSRRIETETALKVAYKELESFSYSIAHDLRAPLRGMHGFAQVLSDDYASKLDAEGLDALEEIRGNAVRMGEQIDALLSLSRVARSPLHRERVDLTELTKSVAARCMAAEPERAVALIVQPGLYAAADAALVRALFDNLLQNAWKFTRTQPAARVEVGTMQHAGGQAFFVRDNGAGFDPQLASRLFTPFQRLHTALEFPGTGIGLATAQRIVHRHGGSIWASAAVGVGATFCFTLPGDGA